MVELTVLQALMTRKRFRTLQNFVPSGMMTPDVQAMITWFKMYYETFPGHEKVDTDKLRWLVNERLPDAEQRAIMNALVDRLTAPVDEEAIKGVLSVLYDLDFAGRAAAIISQYENGQPVDVLTELDALVRVSKRAKSNSRGDRVGSDMPSIGELLAMVENDAGIKFRRWGPFRDGIQGLQGGASIAFGGRPDKGKTSVAADALTDWAPQCAEFFGKDRPIVWFNNEGSRNRIIPRLYSAALNVNLPQMAELNKQGKLEDMYREALGGTEIIVEDMHGASLAHLEQYIEEVNPCAVVWDMLANFSGGGTPGGNKADEVEGKWQYVREAAVRYDFISVATVQISDGGGNQLFPAYNWLKDSRTAIQGATDIILMLGSLDSPDVADLRGLSTPKNKFAVAGFPSYLQAECKFDHTRSRLLFGQDSKVPFPGTQGANNASPNEGVRVGQAQTQNAVPSTGRAEAGRDPVPNPGAGGPNPVPIVFGKAPE